VIWVLEQFVLLALPKFADQGLKILRCQSVYLSQHGLTAANSLLQVCSCGLQIGIFFEFVRYSVSVFQTIAISVRFFVFFRERCSSYVDVLYQ